MAKKKGKSKAKPSIVTKTASIADSINSEIIADALSTANQVVLMKVCRLCETKDGPFLNIFDAEKVTAKKIDELMPFVVAENDELPHKICFRCSAKVEELYEFVQKCINTQENLRKVMNKKGSTIAKTKARKLWEEKLNESNISNEDICDAVIKKAMEGIPLNDISLNHEKPTPNSSKKNSKTHNDTDKDDSEAGLPLKQLKLAIDKCDQKTPPTRSSRSNNSESCNDGKNKRNVNSSTTNIKIQNEQDTPVPSKKIKLANNALFRGEKSDDDVNSVETNDKLNQNRSDSNDNKSMHINNFSLEETPPVQKEKKFDIMDHVSMIKVNGVGVLFQCKLCNRNFLKKEVVLSHGCVKNGAPKVDIIKDLPPPEPPKPPTVMYINTKINNEIKKIPEIKPKVDIEVKKPEVKPKPKIGPASKVKRDNDNVNPTVGMVVNPTSVNDPSPSPAKPATATPSVEIPSVVNFNSRYKLLPGPNNTFTLVEEQSTDTNVAISIAKNTSTPQKTQETKPKERKQIQRESRNKIDMQSSNEIIDLDPQPPPSAEQPYPVGLFQTVPHHSSVYPTPVAAPPVAFPTPAMKKQSYTIVQTGNPSKLLISTKPQVPKEPPQKRQKKKADNKSDTESKQPFTVTLEDSAPPKDPNFFTFINVDPLLQPSYVLPTHNIIQESQISTSTPASQSGVDKEKHKYTCNMCSETFSREKKMLTHIQSHYSKMDEEDQLREKGTKKRTRKQ